MTTNVSCGSKENAGLNLIGGPGGCRAMLASMGMLLALWWVGLRKTNTTGGISGGSLPLRFFASGMPISKIIELAIELDFNSLLDREASMASVLLEHYWSMGGRYKGDLPHTGRFKMERFRAWLEGFFDGDWPDHKPFWTMAIDRSGAQVLLTREGVFRREQGGLFKQLSSVTPPIGQSLCATCAVPGFFVPIELVLDNGEKLLLYDGALSWESFRPLSVVEQHFGAEPRDIIICDVGLDLHTGDRLKGQAWTYLCGGRCVPPLGLKSPSENKAILVLPVVTEVRSFDFSAPSDRKWTAIMEGFQATIDALNHAYRLKEDQYLEARDIMADFNGLRRTNFWGTVLKKAPRGQLSERALNLLADRGVLAE